MPWDCSGYWWKRFQRLRLVGWLCWGLTSQSTIFQSYRDGAIASWVINQYFRGVKCLAQGHNTAAVGLEPRTSRSGVRHSTTEPPRSPQRLRLGTKSLKLSQNSATLGTSSLQEVAASWLRSHVANVHGASSANCFPFSPTAICPFWPEVRCTHHVWGVSCCMQQRPGPWRWIHWTVSGVMTVPWSVGSVMSGQRTKLAQTPFSQSLASRT